MPALRPRCRAPAERPRSARRAGSRRGACARSRAERPCPCRGSAESLGTRARAPLRDTPRLRAEHRGAGRCADPANPRSVRRRHPRPCSWHGPVAAWRSDGDIFSDVLLKCVVLVSVSAFFGLAILGSGGIGPFLAHPARVALALLTLPMTLAALFSQGNLSPGEREDRDNRWVLAIFSALGLGICFLPAYTDRRDLLSLDGDAVR